MKNIPKKLSPKKGINDLKLPYLVLAVSIILTFGITYIFYQSAKSKDQIRFNTNVSRIQNTIEARIGLYIVLLKAVAVLSRQAKRSSARILPILLKVWNSNKNYKGVQGIGYSVIYKSGEKAKSDKLG